MPDLIHEAMLEAAQSFGGTDGTFNLAGLSAAIARRAGVTGRIDGLVARVILAGRSDCVPLFGGAHYRVLDSEPLAVESDQPRPRLSLWDHLKSTRDP